MPTKTTQQQFQELLASSSSSNHSLSPGATKVLKKAVDQYLTEFMDFATACANHAGYRTPNARHLKLTARLFQCRST